MGAIIHKFTGANSGADEQYQAIVKGITKHLNEELSELFGNMFDAADDMLFQLAENADSNEDQAHHFDTMRMLRIERDRLSQHFALQLKSLLNNKTSSEEEKEFDENELSLVDQDELEEMVAISTMSSKAMNLFGESVNHLEARIEFLSMKADIFDKDTFAPSKFCEALKASLSEIDISIETKLLLYKFFEQDVLLKLAPLYTKLNQVFIDLGILPKIKANDALPVTNKTKPATPQHNQESVDTLHSDAVYRENQVCDTRATPSYHYSNQPYHSGGTGGIVQHGATAVTQNSHKVISQYIKGQLTASGPGIPSSFTRSQSSSGNSQYYDRRDVLTALSNLQSKISNSSVEDIQLSAGQFKIAILQDMGRRSGGAITKQVSLIDEKTIDFIEMLFTAIVEDASISEPVTNLLLRLQIPVIKVAMIDDSFFDSGEHPARTSLNMLAFLGRGISEKTDELFIALDKVVDILLNDFKSDINSFIEANKRLKQIEDYEIKKAAQKEELTQKEVLQKHAREVVLAELQHLLVNKILPKPCQKLLLKHWSTLMFNCHIKHGKSSELWSSSALLAKRFINLLQPVQSTQEFYLQEKEKDLVLDEMHSLLLETKQNPVTIETEINNSFLTIQSILENSPFNPENIVNSETYFTSVNDNADLSADLLEPEIEFIEEESANPLDEKADLSRQKIAKLTSDIRPGVWFEVFTGEESRPRRAKLSVIIMEEAKLVFVDRVGVKVIEKDAEEFSQEIEQGLSSVISDHSAFEHALGMVISSLSNAV